MPTAVMIEAAAGEGWTPDEVVDVAVRATGWQLDAPGPWGVWHLKPGVVRVAWFEEAPRAVTADLARIGRSAVKITVGAMSFEDLLGEGSRAASRTFVCTWDALTPTSFLRRGRPYPAPDPALLVHSVAQTWNTHCTPGLGVDAGALAAAARAIAMVAIDGYTKVADTRRGADARPGTGFVGRVRMRVDPSKLGADAAALAALLLAAQWTGVGVGAAHGMGGAQMTFESGTTRPRRQPGRSTGGRRAR